MRQPIRVGGPASWAGSELSFDDDWVYTFDGPQLEHLLGTVEALLPLRRAHGMAGVVREDPVELLAGSVEAIRTSAAVRAQLVDGRGLALIRGLPVGDLDEERLELLIWCIGRRIGRPIHQNPQRDHIVHVRDAGRDFDRPDVRAYETAAELNYHSDSSDVVGLLCVRTAMSGGVSTVVSATRVHDEMVLSAPALARELYEPWWRYNPATDTVEPRPICVRRDDELFTHYGRRYIELGAADPDTPALTERQRASLIAFDEHASRRDLVLAMDLRPGDLQLLNNFRTLHSRTAYTDHPEPDRRRHLCRIWLVLPDEIEPPPEFSDVGIVPRTVALRA